MFVLDNDYACVAASHNVYVQISTYNIPITDMILVEWPYNSANVNTVISIQLRMCR
jgi:hypothetical protein